MLMKDPDFILMREDIYGNQEQFDETFTFAFKNYINGDWDIAYSELKKCLDLLPTDGPTKTLIHYIESYGCQSPDDWEGYRKLTSK